jgi:hypothetical protein
VDQPGDPAIIQTNVKGATGGAGGAASFRFNGRLSLGLDSGVIKRLYQPETITTPGGTTVVMQPGIYFSDLQKIRDGAYYFYCSQGTDATADADNLSPGAPGSTTVNIPSNRQDYFDSIEVTGDNEGYGNLEEFNDVQSNDRIFVAKADSLLDKYSAMPTGYPIDDIASNIPMGQDTGNISAARLIMKPDMDMKISVYGSNTDAAMPQVELASATINTSSKDISLSWEGNYRYICVQVKDNYTALNYPFKMQLRKIQGIKRDDSQDYGRMYSFVYNNDQKYLFLFSAGSIKIYKDDEVIQTVYYSDITNDILKEMKVAYKDDTIVMTHPELRTKQLQRQSDGTWQLSDFPFKNIPVYAFNGETEINHTYRIKPSGTEGVIKIEMESSASIFDDTWVGQIIDGGGGRARITEVVDAKTLSCVTIIPFYTTDTINKWKEIRGYEPVWSDTRGYPGTCLFAQQRLWFGGSKFLPAHIWASRIDDYNNFKNSANSDNDAIDVTMLTNEKIINLVECRGIHVFTSGDEWTAAESSLTPDMFTISKNSSNGSYPGLDAIILNGVVCYVEKNGRSLLSYVYNYEQASYQSDNMSIMTNLINAPARIGCVVNSSVDKGDFLYVVKKDGTMLVACVSIPQHIFSVSEYETDGDVKDVCTLEEDVYLVVKRGSNLYLEKVSEDKVDHALDLTVTNPDNITTSEQAFLMKDVFLYNDTFEVGPCRVTYDGHVITRTIVPEGQYRVGLPYDYELESNPININGKTTNINKRISHATITCKDTMFMEFCGQKKTEKDDVFDFYSCTKYDNDVRFNIKGTFYPIYILSVLLNINYEGGRDE